MRCDHARADRSRSPGSPPVARLTAATDAGRAARCDVGRTRTAEPHPGRSSGTVVCCDRTLSARHQGAAHRRCSAMTPRSAATTSCRCARRRSSCRTSAIRSPVHDATMLDRATSSTAVTVTTDTDVAAEFGKQPKRDRRRVRPIRRRSSTTDASREAPAPPPAPIDAEKLEDKPLEVAIAPPPPPSSKPDPAAATAAARGEKPPPPKPVSRRRT